MEVRNEMGVIVVFAQSCEHRGWRIVSIQQEFPDAVVENLNTGERFPIEFEYRATSFIKHGHDARECNAIVCWENDWSDCPMTIWELSNPDWPSVPVRVLEKQESYILYLECLAGIQPRKPTENDVGVWGYSSNLGRRIIIPLDVVRYFIETMYAGRSLSRSQWKGDESVTRVQWEAMASALDRGGCLDRERRLKAPPHAILERLLSNQISQSDQSEWNGSQEITDDHQSLSESDQTPTSNNNDEILLPTAIDLVRREGGASASLLQRRMSIGYPKAARLIDKMHEMGVIGPPVNGGGTREVLPIQSDKERVED